MRGSLNGLEQLFLLLLAESEWGPYRGIMWVSDTQIPLMGLTKDETALRTDKLVTGTNERFKVMF